MQTAKTKTLTVEQQILKQLELLNANFAEATEQAAKSDWKLWVIMNAVVDAALSQGMLKDDPRSS